MWKCPKCETINNGEVCIVCGEAKTEPQNYTEVIHSEVYEGLNKAKKSTYPVASPESCNSDTPTVKPYNVAVAPVPPTEPTPTKSRKALWITITVILCLAIIIPALYIGILYNNACKALNNGDYDSARRDFSKISFVGDIGDMLDECDYKEALALLENNEVEAARKLFKKTPNYKNAEEMLLECDYAYAVNQMNEGNAISAYNVFNDLGGYRDSARQAETAKEQIYYQGVDKYRLGDCISSKECFEISRDIGNEDDYLLLIEAKTTGLKKVSDLYPLIGFEDTEEILLSDDYIEAFMFGKWESYTDYYIEYYKSGGEYKSRYNLPGSDLKNYKLMKGGHYESESNSNWAKQWTFEIIMEDAIRVKCYNGNTYTLYRT